MTAVRRSLRPYLSESLSFCRTTEMSGAQPWGFLSLGRSRGPACPVGSRLLKFPESPHHEFSGLATPCRENRVHSVLLRKPRRRTPGPLEADRLPPQAPPRIASVGHCGDDAPTRGTNQSGKASLPSDRGSDASIDGFREARSPCVACLIRSL